MSDHKPFFIEAEMTRIAMSQDKEVGVERDSMVGQVTKRILWLGTFFLPVMYDIFFFHNPYFVNFTRYFIF